MFQIGVGNEANSKVSFRSVVGERNIALKLTNQNCGFWHSDSNRPIPNAETWPSANLIGYFQSTFLDNQFEFHCIQCSPLQIQAWAGSQTPLHEPSPQRVCHCSEQ